MPCLGLIEGAAEVAGSGNAVLLLDAAHLHAHVLGFDDNHDAQGMKGLLNALLDLERHAFLNLKAVAVDVDNASYLGKTSDVAVRDIGNVTLAVEWQHVMLAEREEIYILNDNHL